jgi:dCMP deaminase
VGEFVQRPEWDEYFLGMAKYVSIRSSCPTKHVGSVIIDPETNAVLSVGYNGSPRGTAHCGEACASRTIGENSKACRAIHAEMNAILNATFNGVKTRGGRIYVTISPCLSCSRAIIQAGITEVVASGKSPYDKAIEMLQEAGVKLRILSGVALPKVRFLADSPGGPVWR